MPVAAQHTEVGQLRLAELVAALSLVTDLGMGHPPEEAMRTCLLAAGLTRRLGWAESEVADAYWTALLMHVGCTAPAHAVSALFGGDEITVNALASGADFRDAGESLRFLLGATGGMSAGRRGRVLLAVLTAGERFDREVAAGTCEVAAGMARRLGMPATVQRGLAEMFERWDGRGQPRKLAGGAIAMPARVAQVAAQVVVFVRLGGLDAAVAMVRRRAGSALDPELAAAVVRHGRDLLREVDSADPAAAVLAAEPSPQLSIPEMRLDEVARAFAEVVDLKSPFTLGHSTGVAELAEGAGRMLGLGETACIELRRAGLLHDLGRVAVPNGIWEKPGVLTTAEWEQVRLHPYHSERILSRSAALAPIAPVAGMHHERLDGSGYHRQTVAAGLSLPARVLAAADAFQAMTQPRAHRSALSVESAGAELAAEASAGRLDRDAVVAVLAAAGRPPPSGSSRLPGALTDREFEVLRLLARGHSNKQMARELFISPKTVGHHVEHIYQKLGVSSRAAAAFFAVEHRLVP